MSWDGSASNYSDEQYARACVLDRGADAGPPKQRYSLPVRDPSGTLNCDGVAAARGRLNQVTGASAEQIAAAKSKLDALARAVREPLAPAGEFETRELEVTTDGRRIRGVIPYGTVSRDLGGFKEIIEPGALRGTRIDDLVAPRRPRRSPARPLPGHARILRAQRWRALERRASPVPRRCRRSNRARRPARR